jgi:predicted histidine transporter YuiF (NhaC family)
MNPYQLLWPTAVPALCCVVANLLMIVQRNRRYRSYMHTMEHRGHSDKLDARRHSYLRAQAATAWWTVITTVVVLLTVLHISDQLPQ